MLLAQPGLMGIVRFDRAKMPNYGLRTDFNYAVDYRQNLIRLGYTMRIAGRDQAISNLVKWSAKDDWAPYREHVFAEHLDPVMEKLDVTGEEIAEAMGDAFDMLYGVILEDFFTARFGDDSELNVIDDYLKRRGWREKVPAKRYLEAIRDSVISLYEVVDLNPGKAMTVRDLIRGGDSVTVEEKMGSQTAARWDRIAARLVTVNNKTCFTGGMLLLSHDASSKFMTVFDETTKALRTKLRREAKKQGENPEITPKAVKDLLLESSGARLFTQVWLMDTLVQIDAPLPEMRNTDGDSILFSEVRFPITGDEAKVVAVVDGIENVERNAPVGASWTWHGLGSPSQRMAAKKHEGLTFQSVDDRGRTSLGSIEVKSGALLLSTNSRERAERGRDLLASSLGPLVGPPLISHEDIERTLERSEGYQASDEDEIPPEIAAQIIHNYLDDHYRRTLDDPLLVLDGKSPRQAVKTKKGRAQVVEWLKRLENSEHRRGEADGHAPYDMAWMWKELNLNGER